MHDRIYDGLQYALDAIWSLPPRKAPAVSCIPNLVAHRGNTGEADAPDENTLCAFQRCAELGVWGIELDVRWTADNVPVVIHDDHTGRTFAAPKLCIAETNFSSLRKSHPELPRLSEVIESFGGDLHLMIELKSETMSQKQKNILAAQLKGLEPGIDYHLLSLNPQFLSTLRCFSIQAMMPVALTNTAWVIEQAIHYSFTCISGHYLLLSRKKRLQLYAAGIEIGSGFIPNQSLLFRELAQPSRWIFSNHAALIQPHLSRLEIN